MLMNLNGRERTVNAFNNMFNAVEPKLRLQKVYRPPRGELSLLEITLA
jgi:6-hydroxytryprostatin B O-methyltransferase